MNGIATKMRGHFAAFTAPEAELAELEAVEGQESTQEQGDVVQTVIISFLGVILAVGVIGFIYTQIKNKGTDTGNCVKNANGSLSATTANASC